MEQMVKSGSSVFWDDRYKNERDIWGYAPSSTAIMVSKHIFPRANILEIGCGYGRDLQHYVSLGCRVTGVDPSREGICLAKNSLLAENSNVFLIQKPIENVEFLTGTFDFIISHRTFHLFLSDDSLHNLVMLTEKWLKKNGILCIGTRDERDVNLNKMQSLGGGVYEYINRPGHKIRCFTQSSFDEFFGCCFDILSCERCVEIEAKVSGDPCYISIIVARKK